MNKKTWIKKGKFSYLDKIYFIYKYNGTGHFPEVFMRLQNKIGRIFYVNYQEEIIHITLEQEALL